MNWIGIIFIVGYVMLHIFVAVEIYKDAQKLSYSKSLFLGSYKLWGFAGLLLGPVVVPFYWVFHYSNLKEKE